MMKRGWKVAFIVPSYQKLWVMNVADILLVSARFIYFLPRKSVNRAGGRGEENSSGDEIFCIYVVVIFLL